MADLFRTESSPGCSVALVCMPWQPPSLAALGLCTLTSIIRDADMTARVMHFNMLLHARLGGDLYGRLSRSHVTGQLLFTPVAFDLEGSERAHWMDAASGVAAAECGLTRPEFEHLACEVIPAYLDECAAVLSQCGAGVVGFSLTYYQNLPVLALCRQLKRRQPAVVTMLGGFGAFGDSGRELIKNCDYIDIVFDGEAENTVVPVLRAVFNGDRLQPQPGVSFRDSAAGGAPVLCSQTAPLIDLDTLPVPEFGDFVYQKKAAEIEGDTWLSFEASRGCWWGAHSLCTFCGLNGPTPAYRTKSAARLIRELRHQWVNHGVTHFSAADNILTNDHKATLFEELAALRREMRELVIFFQIKSNLDREDANSLRESGISVVQPGIEAFSDRLLRLMRKGADSRTQIQCLKFLGEQGIRVIYGMLHNLAGETAEDFREQLEIVRQIQHLPPPSYFSPVSYDRYSHYHQFPSLYGIEGFAVPEELNLIYPKWSESHSRITNSFRPRLKSAPDGERETRQAVAKLREQVAQWQSGYRPGQLTYTLDKEGRLVIVADARAHPPKRLLLTEEQSRIFLSCEHATPVDKLRRRAGLPDEVFGRALDSLLEEHLVLARDTWALALPLRRPRRLVVGIMGPSCAGKSTLCGLLRELDVAVIDVGEIIMELGSEVWALPPQEKLKLIGKGESVFHFVAPRIQCSLIDNNIIAIDSLKARDDLRILTELLPEAELKTLHVTADPSLRMRRFAERARPGDEPTLAGKEERLKEIGIDDLLRHPDHTLVNNGSLDEFRGMLTNYLAGLRPRGLKL